MQLNEFIFSGFAIFIAVPFLLLPWVLLLWLLKKVFGKNKDKESNNG